MVHTLLVFDPGHFHVALLLYHRNPRVSSTVHVYAPPGPDVEKFQALVESFNKRPADPTAWQLELHLGQDALEAMIAERKGSIVLLAGRNASRLALMHRLHDEGFHVLADKPWLTDAAALPHLDAITSGPPLAIDVMTGRHDVMAQLRNRIVASRDLFGALESGESDQPALEFTSRHHLIKQVGGETLQRPAWFYDSRIQGDGLVDIQSHYVDQAQWLIGGDDHRFDPDRDIEIVDAKRWTTPVPIEHFRESTGEASFPETLAGDIEGDTLQLACNGRIDYRLCDIPVRQNCEWGLREPEGGGDLHGFTARGSKAEVTVRVSAETGFKPELRLQPRFDLDVDAVTARFRVDFPALIWSPTADGVCFSFPDSARPGHDAQFPMMLEQFLDLAESPAWPATIAARIRTRYTLLARARTLALSPA
jgi:predicted dehydrogenase